MFGKWSYINFGPEDRGDWTYETARGLRATNLVRKNIGISGYVQDDWKISVSRRRSWSISGASAP